MAKKKSARGQSASQDNPNDRLIARNRKARHDYEVIETLEAGMVLVGSEVKSLRAGRVNLVDAWAEVRQGEVFLHNLHISPYEQANRFNEDPMRTRRLLLNRTEIRQLVVKTEEKQSLFEVILTHLGTIPAEDHVQSVSYQILIT